MLGTPVMELTRVNTLPLESSSSDKPQSPSDHHKLGRLKTETPRHSIGFVQEAANVFDNKISEQKVLDSLSPWSEGPCKDVAEKDALGGLSVDGFLSQLCLRFAQAHRRWSEVSKLSAPTKYYFAPVKQYYDC